MEGTAHGPARAGLFYFSGDLSISQDLSRGDPEQGVIHALFKRRDPGKIQAQFGPAPAGPEVFFQKFISGLLDRSAGRRGFDKSLLRFNVPDGDHAPGAGDDAEPSDRA